jgi:hypothetical protein
VGTLQQEARRRFQAGQERHQRSDDQQAGKVGYGEASADQGRACRQDGGDDRAAQNLEGPGGPDEAGVLAVPAGDDVLADAKVAQQFGPGPHGVDDLHGAENLGGKQARKRHVRPQPDHLKAAERGDGPGQPPGDAAVQEPGEQPSQHGRMPAVLAARSRRRAAPAASRIDFASGIRPSIPLVGQPAPL